MQSKNSEKRSFCPLIFKQKHFKYIRIPLLLLLVREKKQREKKSVSRVAEVEPLKGRTSQEAINRGSKNEGDKAKGDLASHDFFGGGELQSFPDADNPRYATENSGKILRISAERRRRKLVWKKLVYIMIVVIRYKKKGRQ